ncbi:hypothetical protein BT96DRAFT_843091 [Gymnopus androsaceus JB14]|uniref:Uncharacterized protein n=1 Tax=Gymnopus androsaceus JB14 TaxID=1447944 RepID=A0A6A4GES0_9AGAR|nr:hypothetical protein BT96DRAFT_843091 [Gymnopus androsaceus JB14]
MVSLIVEPTNPSASFLAANLALDPSIRYLPENMYINIIPGPNEPSVDKIDHYVRPVIEQFARAWSARIQMLLHSRLRVRRHH